MANNKTPSPTMAYNKAPSATKVFKKASPNGKVSAYLSNRDFVDHITHIAPVDGVVEVGNGYLQGRKVFARVTVTYRFGRQEDEIMGLLFSKEMQLVNTQVVPSPNSGTRLTEVQDRLMKKLGPNAYPFTVTLPERAPNSVTIEADDNDQSANQPLGVVYELRLYIADEPEEKPHKRNSVAFVVRKVQYAPEISSGLQPQTLVCKRFLLSSGKLNLDVVIDSDVCFHGQPVTATYKVNNHSRKSVKSVKTQVLQYVEVTMTNTQYTKIVAEMVSKEGCPISPESNLQKKFQLLPLASSNMAHFGIALDGATKDADVNLASSTQAAAGKSVNDALGIIISYVLRVKLDCGAIAGDLVADLPFKLLHPNPEKKSATNFNVDTDIRNFRDLRRGRSLFEE